MPSATSAVNVLLTLQDVNAVYSGLARIQGGIATVTAALGQFAFAATLGRKALDMGSELNALSARTREAVRDIVVLQRAFETTRAGASQLGPILGKLQQTLADLRGESQRLAPVWARLLPEIRSGPSCRHRPAHPSGAMPTEMPGGALPFSRAE